ncbi:MAG: sugar phosphate nucleotidyltransferase [Thermoplasmata archaeon]|nr:sugar phosphate nucleotidyltransferase [Thermoplasmata archaeon]
MKAVVLAAGEGKRLKPLTAKIPKPLIPVAGKPLLLHTLDALKNAGIEEIGVVVHQHEAQFREMFEGKEGITLIRQERPAGTGDAVKAARKFCDSEFVCINGDIVFDEAILKVLLEKGKGGKNVLAAVERKNTGDYGTVESDGDVLVKIHEKARYKGDYINAGIYYFTPEIFEALEKIGVSPRGEYELTDAINLLAAQQKVVCIRSTGPWEDIGKPWELLKANEILLRNVQRQILGGVEDYAVVKGNVVIGEGTVVHSGTYIVGPAYIGKNCRIGPNAYIRPSTYIGDNCHVGNASEIKNSIIMANSNAPHFNYVGDSIIGMRVNLGAGTKIANLRLDGKEIHSFVQGVRVPTGLRKFGAIIGDDCKLGINCSINPGTVLSEECWVAAGKAVEARYYLPGTRIM